MALEQEKNDSQLDIALELDENELENSTLNTGYDFSSNLWEVIVKYNGNIKIVENELNVQIEILSSSYAIITLNRDKIDSLLNYRQIEYVEKPKLLKLMLNNSLRSSCITPITNNPQTNLKGNGVIVAVIDSGIDYTHPDFRNEDGTSRILYLWDQTSSAGTPPLGFYDGTEYNKSQIDEALKNVRPLEILYHEDTIGHGTHVAGIAAGNGRKSGGTYAGAAPESSLIIVKLGEKGRESFARNTEIMRAVKYILDKAIELNMPVAINLSFGTNDGSHSGDSLFETYINDMANIWKCSICVASGNEGASGHHFSGKVMSDEVYETEIVISGGLKSLFISLWKNYTDKMNFELIAPGGESTGIIRYNADTVKYTFQTMSIYTNIGRPTPYSINQQVFFEIIANRGYVYDGIWLLKIYGSNIVDGTFNMWLPIREAVSSETSFTRPDIYTTLTIPSTAQNVITVGGYNSLTDSIADFSGRGYTRNNEMIKPDITAPAYGITAPSPGGYDTLTGTSMAAPHVTGACAILMQWGIVQGNDPFMYGQKLKAYLRLGAKRNNNMTYPNREWGYGSLCLAKTFENLQYKPIPITAMQNKSKFNNSECEDIIYSDDYIDFLIELNSYTRQLIENSPEICYCHVLENDYAIVYINKNNISNFNNLFKKYTVVNEPYLLGLMDMSALEDTGILNVRNMPYLNLTGQGVLIGIVDTGIDYTKDIFKYEDGTTKIYSIWDQTISHNPPGYSCFGTEYTREEINEALASDSPFDVVPTRDELGHGTFLASISAGREDSQNNFSGAAPDAELIVVKLKEAKQYFREEKALFNNAHAYQSNDLMIGIDYIKSTAQKLNKPVAICIGMGTNEGSHNGNSVLENYISSIAMRSGIVICEACGNEANARHHSLINITNTDDNRTVEFRVGENEKGFLINTWAYVPDRISVSITSPLGEEIQRIQPIPNSRQEIKLSLSNTIITVEYLVSSIQGIGQQIKLRFISPSAGIWRITIYGDTIVNGYVHSWLPISPFLDNDTFFLTPDPSYTTVVPATGRTIISVGGFNNILNSIFTDSSRGPNTLSILNPLFVTPSVNVYGVDNEGYTRKTGTSVAAAIAAGASALLLEWGIVKGNDYLINSISAASYFIRGTVQRTEGVYPNNIWGYGTLDLYNTFRQLL